MITQAQRSLWSVAVVCLTLAGCAGESNNLTATQDDDTDNPVTNTAVTNTMVPVSSAISTDNVECMYSYSEFNNSPSVNMTSSADWFCDATSRWLAANGIPDHDVGTFPNAANPNTITTQAVSASFTLTPVATSTATTLGGPQGAVGYVLNGVKIDPGTGGTCNDAGNNCSLGGAATGSWRIEALGQNSFDFGEDANNAHVQPTGSYHYHGMPEGFIAKLNKGTAMTLIGWAADGFPIYARYGYSDPLDASSPIREIQSSYALKTQADANRPDESIYAMGTFSQDYEYVAGLGDLDECNGRTGVTPEFPDGIYHYFATDSYPFLQRCIKGAQ
ncbi:MAG: YHYH protein [Gammaproteobacteria bacterium]|nr:YHYH protein [Gammaproteobacteria bacterium]